MKSSEQFPTVGLSSGLSIGYREPLAKVDRTDGDILLESGTHYLLARNGRGKTTLLRTLAGVLKPLGGDYRCGGRCQLLSEDLVFDRELPAKVILKAMLTKDKCKQAMELAQKLELDLCKPYGKLSTGNKRKVALLVAEFSVGEEGSDILLLDEPFTGLDAFSREVFQDLWRRRQDGVLRLVSCHPDFDGMEMKSAILIADGEISHGGEGVRSWADFKTQLT